MGMSMNVEECVANMKNMLDEYDLIPTSFE